MRLQLLAALLLLLHAHGATAAACPVARANGCCNHACQLDFCRGLASFAEAFTDPEQPWIHPWPSGAAACNVPPPLAGTPSDPWYCSWHGVTCNPTPALSACSSSFAAQRSSITRLDLSENGLVGWIDNETRIENGLRMLHDCGLTELILGGGDLGINGTLASFWGTFTNLTQLAIPKSSIYGLLPSNLGNLVQLRQLDLNGNYFYGTIPASLSRLTRLQVLNLAYNGWSDLGFTLHGTIPDGFSQLRQLSQLLLELNQLSGVLPPMCDGGPDPLQVLSLRNNKFSGRADWLGLCENLRVLDLGANRFSGRLPQPVPFTGNLTVAVGPANTPPLASLFGYNSTWSSLLTLRLGDNAFTSTIPEILYRTMPLLTVLDVGGNRLSGSISRAVTLLNSLEELDLGSNELTGTLPLELAYLSRIGRISLSENCGITGIIPEDFRLTRTLTLLDWAGTSLTGPLLGAPHGQASCSGPPAGFARLYNLQLVDMQRTLLQADCGPEGCLTYQDALPWFLNFTAGYEQPRQVPGGPSVQGMLCRRVEQLQYCMASSGPFTINGSKNPASWMLSPFYYHYTGCKCEDRYREVWELVGSRTSACGVSTRVPLRTLTCQPNPALSTTSVVLISTLVSAAGMLLVLYCAYVSYYGSWGLPKKLQTAAANMRKRLEGAPRSGWTSLVVTDIQGYSALVSSLPIDVMHSAMATHNSIMRKAAWQHYGFVIGQEGDSFIVAFRAAVDAVSFCLQAQQALQKAVWPAELLPTELAHPHAHSTLPRRPFSFLRGMGGSGGEVRSFTVPSLAGAGFNGDDATGDPAGAQQSAFSEADLAPGVAGLGGGNRHEWITGRPFSAGGGVGASSSRRSSKTGGGGLHGSSNRGSSSRRITAGASPSHLALQVQDSIPDSSIGSVGTSVLNEAAGLRSISERDNLQRLNSLPEGQPAPAGASRPPMAAAAAAAAVAAQAAKSSVRSSKGASVWRRWGLSSDATALQRQQQQQQQQQREGEEQEAGNYTGSQSHPIAIPGAASATAAAGRGYTNVEPSDDSSNGGLLGWEANGMPGSGGSSFSGRSGPRLQGPPRHQPQPPPQEGMSSSPLQPPPVAKSAALEAAAALLVADKDTGAAASNGLLPMQQQEAWTSAAVAKGLPGSYPKVPPPPVSTSPPSLHSSQQRLPGTSSGAVGSTPGTPQAPLSSRVSFDAGASAFEKSMAAVVAASAAAGVPGEAPDPLAAAAAELIRGLRVRIGVATCELDGSEEISSSRLLDVTKLVSDAGAGGQTLMDATTFERIKDRLAELGAVKAEGMDKRQLRGTPRGWLARIIARYRPVSWSEAVVLDMGVYSIPSLKRGKGDADSTPASTAPTAAAGAAAGAAGAPEGAAAAPPVPAGGPGKAGSSSTAAKAGAGAAAAAAAEAARGASGAASPRPKAPSLRRDGSGMSGGGLAQQKGSGRKQSSQLMSWYLGVTAETHMEAAQHDDSLVHLYQVLPPSLLQRARVFGNKLDLPEGSLCHDLPYFCAPAAAVMPLLPVLRSAAGDLQLGGSSHHPAGSVPSGSAMGVTGVARAPSYAPATPGSGGQRGLGDVQLVEVPLAAAAASPGVVGGYPVSSSPSTSAGFVAPSRHQRPSLVQPGIRRSGSFQQLGRSRSGIAGGMSNFSSVWSGLVTNASKRSASRPVTPPVTFVFCAVEGMKPLKHLMLGAPHLMQHTSMKIAAVMRQALLMVNAQHCAAVAAAPADASHSSAGSWRFTGSWPSSMDRGMEGVGAGVAAAGSVGSGAEAGAVQGGYFCRELVGDMKYMLAFGCPELAAAWCLLMQDLLMWQEWPPQLLSLPQFKEEWSGGARGSGQLLFRGPRIRIGLCKGPPQSVIPDHQGRADYLGMAVNRAARFQDACAHGGQVVCEAAMAEYLVEVWRQGGVIAEGKEAAPAMAPAPAAGAGAGAAAAAAAAIQPPLQEPDAPGLAHPQPLQPPQLTGAAAGALAGQPSVLVLPAAAIAEGVETAAAAGGGGSSQALAGGAASTSDLSFPRVNRSGGATGSRQLQPAVTASGPAPADLALSPFWGMQQLAESGAGQGGTSGQRQVQQWLSGQAASPPASGGAPAIPMGSRGSSLPVSTGISGSPQTGHQYLQQQQQQQQEGQELPSQPGSFTLQPQESVIPLSIIGASGAAAGPGGGDPGMARTSAAALLDWLTAQLTPTEVSCPLYLSTTPCSSFTVHVHEVGLFHVKGDPGPTNVVQLSLSHLTGRLPLLPTEPPKGKGQCLETRSGCLHVVPGVPLPAAAQEAATGMLPILRMQADAAAAAAAAAATSAPGGLPPRGPLPSQPQQQQLFRRQRTLAAITNTFSRASWRETNPGSPAEGSEEDGHIGRSISVDGAPAPGLAAYGSLGSSASSRRLPSSVAAVSLSLRQRSTGTMSSGVSRTGPSAAESQSSQLGPLAGGSSSAAAVTSATEAVGAVGVASSGLR